MHFLLVDPCRGYQTLDDADRNLATLQPNVGDSDCDSFPEKWYRFAGDAGTRMPTKNPAKHDPPFPVWLKVDNNRLPYKGEGVKNDIKACFPFHDSTCSNKYFRISVKNCSSYLVYKLLKIPLCPYRYYGTN